MLTDPVQGIITDTSLLDFFTYRGAEISEASVVIFFRFYCADTRGMTFNEFEYFLTFQRHYIKVQEERAKIGLDNTFVTDESSYNYLEEEDIIFELIMRELMLFELLFELASSLTIHAGFDENVKFMYRLMVPSIHVDLKDSDVLNFMEKFTTDGEICGNVRHVMARLDITNDYIVNFPDFKLFFERIGSPVGAEQHIDDCKVLSMRITRSGKNPWNQHSKYGQLDPDEASSFKILNSSARPGRLTVSPSKTEIATSRSGLSARGSQRSIGAFSASKLMNTSYYSAIEMDDDKKNSLMTKKRTNYAGSILDENCENQLGALTLAEVRDIFRKYIRVVMDFDRLNKITSIKEEICLKEVYLLLLNLKNGTYDRSLNSYKFGVLFQLLDIDLNEE